MERGQTLREAQEDLHKAVREFSYSLKRVHQPWIERVIVWIAGVLAKVRS